MINLEYRKLNTKNLMEYIKNVHHLFRDKADKWVQVNDHSPSLFDIFQLEVKPENNFMAKKSLLLCSLFSNEYEETCLHRNELV